MFCGEAMSTRIAILSLVVLISTLLRLHAQEAAITRLDSYALQPDMTNYYDLKLGDSREKVISYLGKPNGVVNSDTGQVMAYSNCGNVSLHEGKVTHFWLTSHVGIIRLWQTLSNNQKTEQGRNGNKPSFKWKVTTEDKNEHVGVWDVETTIPFLSVFMKAREGTLVLSKSQGQTLAQVAFRGGQLEGACKFWYSNGKPWMDGQYHNGLCEGVWTVWNEDGTPRSPMEFNASGIEVR
jgi:hypothetical protein